jgi:RNA polymerase sigma-70 factor (ECF subfamily)
LNDLVNINSDFLISDNGLSGQDELKVLIGQCIAHSRSAQKKLYDLYAPDAYGIIKRLIYNDEPRAKEILNTAFYKVFKDLEKFAFQGAFEGWIRKIVVHTVADHMRQKIKAAPQREVLPEDAYIDSESVENLSHKELLKIVATLPDAQREVFNLFVFENYSHKEIAKLLNINQNNCRWHLNDARRRLKEKINALVNK